MESWQPGSRFGELEIVRQLGCGAFGRVYLARDTLVGRPVALKVLRIGGGTAEHERAALLREAQLVGRLRSPHVATLYRVHALPDGWVFELEYVEGGSLDDRLARETRLPADEARRIARGILLGLRSAHEHGVVHGDVKPGNVLFAKDGTVKLVDFGLSRLVGELSLRMPRPEIAGTPVYMAPEVVMGEPPTAAADLWSAGVVLYRMLSGRMPFAANTLPALFYAIQNAEPPSLDAGLPGDMAELAMRCLAKAPPMRPASCAEALVDLEPAVVAEQLPRTPRSRIGPTRRLHGRHREQGRLEEAAAQAARGRGTTVLLRGEPGSGKSALVQDLMTRSAGQGFRWVEARLTPLEGLLRPLLVSVRDILAPRDGPGQPLVESRLFGTATHLLRALLQEESLTGIDSRQQIFWGVENLLRGLAAQAPLGIAVEDAHQGDDADLGLLTEMSRRLRDARVLLAITMRPEAAAPGLADLLALHPSALLEVAPLDADAISRILRERAQDALLAPEVLRYVLDRAEGNPLLAIEIFRQLEETGALARSGALVVPGPNWGRTTLPQRLRDVLLLRLRGLLEEERTLLDVAAVAGLEFEADAVAAVLERPVLDVLRSLQAIYRRTGLTTPQARGYRLASAVLQEALYEDLAPDLRRAVHRKLAARLEEQPTTQPAVLGLHWERAGEPERARQHLLAATRGALRRQEYVRAVELAGRAGISAHMDAELSVRHAELLFELCSVLGDLGRHEEAEALLARLLEGANSASDANLALKATVLRATIHYQSRGLVGLNEEGLRHAAERLPVSVHRGRACYLLGLVAKYRSDLDEAERSFRLADEVFVACGDLGRHSSALDQLGSVALRRGRWHEAEALYGDAARISAACGRRTNAAISDVNLAQGAFNRGILDGIEERIHGSINILVHEGALLYASTATVALAEVRYAAGRLADARAAIDEALVPLRQRHYLVGLVPATFAHAQFAAVGGSLDLARQALSENERLGELRGERSHTLLAALLQCHVACFAGDIPGARRAAHAAVRVAETMKEPPPRRDAALWLAEAVIYGLPPGALADVERLMQDGAADGSAYGRLPLALARAMRCATEGADPGPLLEAADLLRGDHVGPRRAVLRVIASVLEAEARGRLGDEGLARECAKSGLRDALALGHVWLTLRLRGFLGRAGDAEQTQLLGEDVRRLSALLPSDDERRLLAGRWHPHGPA